MNRSKEENHLIPEGFCREALEMYNVTPSVENAYKLINQCYSCDHIRVALFQFIFLKLNKDFHWAEDIYIETMIRLFKRLVNNQKPINNLWAYLKQIAYNEIKKFWIKKKNQKTEYLNENVDFFDNKDNDVFSVILNSPASNDIILHVIKPILTPKELEALRLRNANSYSNEQIAEIMKVSVDTVYNLIWQAFKKIQSNSDFIIKRLSELGYI